MEYYDTKCVFPLKSVQTLKQKEKSLQKLSSKVSPKDKERTLSFIRWYHRIAKKCDSLSYVNTNQSPLEISFSVSDCVKNSVAVVRSSDSSLVNLKILENEFENCDEIWVWKGDSIFNSVNCGNHEFPPPSSEFLLKSSEGNLMPVEIEDPSVLNFVPSPEPLCIRCFTPPPEFCD